MLNIASSFLVKDKYCRFQFKIFFSFISSIRRGTEANQALRDKFSLAVSAALEDVDVADKNLLSSIDRQYLVSRFKFTFIFFVICCTTLTETIICRFITT